MFFFFKQKTAYEMRISDWSSDVCSSDLRAPSSHPGPAGRFHLLRGNGATRGRQSCHHGPLPCRALLGRTRPCPPARTVDRKSVVEGKSVSVRVDLGGRRIIKKKNKLIVINRDIV